MEIRLDSEGCVPWTRKARLLREGIEIVSRFRSREFVPWHQITNVGAQDDTFCIFGEDSARPLGAVRAYETNALPGTYLVLKRIGTQLDRPIAETAPEIPAGCLPCPTCREPTDSLKQYEFYWITLFFGHFSTRRERFAGCPRCMRRYLVFSGPRISGDFEPLLAICGGSQALASFRSDFSPWPQRRDKLVGLGVGPRSRSDGSDGIGGVWRRLRAFPHTCTA